METALPIPDSRLKVRLREIERRLLRLFGGRSSRDVEYDFAYRNIAGKQLRIVDIGGCDSLLPLTFAKAGHSVTVYDFRPYLGRHLDLTAIQGHFHENQLPCCSFHAVATASTVEHVDLEGYGTLEHADSDFGIVGKLHHILAGGDRVILVSVQRGMYSSIRGIVAVEVNCNDASITEGAARFIPRD